MGKQKLKTACLFFSQRCSMFHSFSQSKLEVSYSSFFIKKKFEFIKTDEIKSKNFEFPILTKKL